jgi:mono/diheme cytochrome c family protein
MTAMRKIVFCGLVSSTVALAAGLTFTEQTVAAAQTVAAGPIAAAAPTFNKDVAPILYKNCVSCHQPESMAPMSLLDYKTARPYARAIRAAVESRTMPPWFADPQYGHFSNNPSLSDKDIQTIKAWVDGGAREGDAKDLPPQPVFAAGFKLGPPDIIIDIGQDFVIPPGDDVRKTFTVPTNFTEGKWIRAAEVLPGNPELVHHVHLGMSAAPGPDVEPDEEGQPRQPKRQPGDDGRSQELWEPLHDGQKRLRDSAPIVNDACAGNLPALPSLGATGAEGGSFATMLPGKGPDIFDPIGDGSMAKWIPAGAMLSFSMHYAKVNKPATERTRVGLYLAKRVPDSPVRRMDVRNHYFYIPPGANRQEVKRCITFPADRKLLSITPHMHYRGKEARYELVRPDGRREALLYVPNYNFNWQLTYRFQEPVFVEKGSQLIVTFHYDNSRVNRMNPDPTKILRWGDRSEDEMMTTWTEVTDVSPTVKKTAANQR